MDHRFNTADTFSPKSVVANRPHVLCICLSLGTLLVPIPPICAAFTTKSYKLLLSFLTSGLTQQVSVTERSCIDGAQVIGTNVTRVVLVLTSAEKSLSSQV